MFEAQTPPNPNEPEDILYPLDGQIQPGEIKSALAHQKLKPVSAGVEPMVPEPPAKPSSELAGAEVSPPLLSKKGIFIAGGIVVLVALVAGTFWVLWRTPKKSAPVVAPPPGPIETAPVAPVITPEVAPEVTVPPPAEMTPPAAPVDSDSDGLTDDEEATHGTNPSLADTDNDDLTDYEEIMIWKTNPLNPDSDGDSFSDGTEVKNNYNPNGTGKLLELPK